MFQGGLVIIDELSPEAQEEKRQNLIDAYLREYEGAKQRGLEETMEAVAAALKEEFNVDIDDVENTRQAPAPEPEPPAEVERAVPDQPVERAVAPAAKKTAASSRKGTAAAIRGGRGK